MDNFEVAARTKLRFVSDRGSELTPEAMWDLPLQSSTKSSLESIGLVVVERLKAIRDVISLVDEKPVDSSETAKLELQLAIIKHIIQVKKADNEKSRNANIQRQTEQRLMELIANRKDQETETKTLAELEQLLSNVRSGIAVNL